VPDAKALTQQALDQLINEKAQLQQARDNGIRIDDTEVDQTEATIARQNQVSKEELYKRVATEGLSVTAFREQLRSQLMISRLREREVDNRARVSDTDVEQFIQTQQAGKPSTGLSYDLNLGMILVAVPENASDKEVAELQAKALQISKRAKAGENFATLAAAFSQATDKGANGGEMGLRPADRYPTLFVDSTQSLTKGDISEPVRSGAGFHILKVLDKNKPNSATPPLFRHARVIYCCASPTSSMKLRRAIACCLTNSASKQVLILQTWRVSSHKTAVRKPGATWVGPALVNSSLSLKK